jgi:hypothetical protein
MNLKTLTARVLGLLTVVSFSIFQACDDDEPKDAIAPEVTIANVTEGMMVINSISITADATDNIGVATVDLFVDNNLLTTDTDAPYEFSWDSKTVADGNHVIKIVATDISTNATEKTVTVNVQNTSAPELAITNVTEGANVRNTLVVQATASDNAGVAKLELYVGNTLIATDAVAPYEFSWDSNTVGDGAQILKVKATDNSGNVAEKSVTVNVQNILVTINVAAQHLDMDPDWMERGFVFLSDSEGKLITSQEYTNGTTITLRSSTFNGDKFYLTEVLNEKKGPGTTATRSRAVTYANVERGKKWVLTGDYEDPEDVYVGKANLTFTNVAANYIYDGSAEGDSHFYIEAPTASASLDITRDPALLYVVKYKIDDGSGTPLPAPTYNLYSDVKVGSNSLNLGLVNKTLTKKTITFPADVTESNVYVTGFPVANDFTREVYSLAFRTQYGAQTELYYPSTAFAGYSVETYYRTPTIEYWRQTTSTDFTVPNIPADVDFTFIGGQLTYKATGTDFLSMSIWGPDENTWSFILPPATSLTAIPALVLPTAIQGFTIPALGIPSTYGVYDFEEITSYTGLLTFIGNSALGADELYNTGKNLIDIQYFGSAVNGRAKNSQKRLTPFGKHIKK